MRLRKGTPGEGGGTPRREQFAYLNTPAGMKHTWNGWLACDPYWARGHEHKPPGQIGSKPCLQWLTRGAVRCPWCRPGCEIKDLCWVHLYREVDTKPVLVICTQTVADVMGGLGFGVYALVGRVEEGSSTFVKRSDAQRPWVSTLEVRRNPIDIAVSLLGIWNYAPLNQWYTHGSPAAPVPEVEPIAPGRFRLSVPTPTTDVEALAIDAERKAPGADAVGGALERVLKRAKRAERNGDHKPEGGG